MMIHNCGLADWSYPNSRHEDNAGHSIEMLPDPSSLGLYIVPQGQLLPAL